MAKTLRLRRPRSSAIEIQISARVHAPAGSTFSRNVIKEAIDYKIENGDDPPGIELRIVRWRHGKHLRWKHSTDEHAEWARFGRLLQLATVTVSAVRHSQGDSEE